MVICLERGADLHLVQLMPLPLTVSCFSKIQIGLPFWYRLTWVVPEKGPLNGCVCVCACVYYSLFSLTSRKSAGCQQWTFGEPLPVPVPSVLWASRSRGTCRKLCLPHTKQDQHVRMNGWNPLRTQRQSLRGVFVHAWVTIAAQRPRITVRNLSKDFR